jgi:hypothetical protein
MDRAPFFTRRLHRGFLLRALTAALLCGATAAAVAGDGLKIYGSPPKTATVGQGYSFTPAVYDPSKRRVTFKIANKPGWANFSTTTGRLYGTPTSGYAGRVESNILITAWDGVSAASLDFSLTVQGASTADKPVISGTPATSVIVGSTYVFQPAARDPAGKTLSFSIQNKPAWASFSIANGLLDGHPSATQTGTYGNIVISASNGQYSSALPAFSIIVDPSAATGTAKVSWVVPTVNTNGSPLTDLAGVRIYYGTSQSALNQSVQVNGTSTTSYTLSGLSAGTWYFGAEAFTTNGLASSMSTIVSKTIP